MTRTFQLKYDAEGRVLELVSNRKPQRWIQISDEVSVAPDARGHQLAALRIADFPWFVDYSIIARLLGPDVVTPLSKFQSDVVDRHLKGAKRLSAPVREEERKLVGSGAVLAFHG